jgi:hypothetical protein
MDQPGEVKLKTTKLKLTPEQLQSLEAAFGKEFAARVKEITVVQTAGRLEIIGGAN